MNAMLFDLNRSILLLGLLAAPTYGMAAEKFTVDPGDTLLAMVTHKAGLASGMAHNHIVVATRFDLDLDLAREDAGYRGEISATVPVEALTPDDPTLVSKWFPVIEEHDLLDHPDQPGADDRATIKDNMLAEDQLDGKKHPTIEARLGDIERDQQGALTAELSLTIKGKTKEQRVPITLVIDSKKLELDFAASFRFTDFGIEPYSAFLGAVKNQDEFNVVAKVRAAASQATEEAMP